MDSISMNNTIEQFAELTCVNEQYFDWHDTGKSIPFIGYSWDTVYFNDVIDLGYTSVMTGFMEDDKWGYPSFRLTDEQQEEVIVSLVDMCDYWNRAEVDLSVNFDPEFNQMLIDFSALLDSFSASYLREVLNDE